MFKKLNEDFYKNYHPLSAVAQCDVTGYMYAYNRNQYTMGLTTRVHVNSAIFAVFYLTGNKDAVANIGRHGTTFMYSSFNYSRSCCCEGELEEAMGQTIVR
jgi:hypothetical protein